MPPEPTESPYNLPYEPRKVADPPGIGLIGCGGISKHHLQAYRGANYPVLALGDLDLERAQQRRDEFYPDALATDDVEKVLASREIAVVDITTHPADRPALIEAALLAGKHVLSQKPFVLDLEVGRRLADLADEKGVLLAVNQNARWAPHFSYLREAAAAGLLGTLHSVHFAVHWDHSWVQGTPFEQIRYLILYDYAIHWFDLLACLMGARQAKRVFATDTVSPSQKVATPLLGQVVIEFEDAQASLVFDGNTPVGEWASYVVTGSEGLLRCEGLDSNGHQPVLMRAGGEWRPNLQGKWFDDGFHGAMAELLAAIEEKRQPNHSARENLRSLELCFAAVASAASGRPELVGSVTSLRAT